MTALQYMGTGIIFGGFAGICFVGAIVFFFATRHKKYLYAERFRKIKFPKQFYIDLLGEYEKTDLRYPFREIFKRESSKKNMCIQRLSKAQPL